MKGGERTAEGQGECGGSAGEGREKGSEKGSRRSREKHVAQQKVKDKAVKAQQRANERQRLLQPADHRREQHEPGFPDPPILRRSRRSRPIRNRDGTKEMR